MKVLSVDDSPANRYLVEAMLKGQGIEVVSASNGVEALERLQAEKFDLIISDILMPQMDGFQLCREVKKRPQLRGVPFIFYTATYTEPADERFALSLGASRFVLKPAEPSAFSAMLGEVVAEERRRPSGPSGDPAPEEVLLSQYNARLIHKLEQKLVELEAAHREEAKLHAFLQSVMDATEDLVFVKDRAGRHLYVNAAAQRRLGRPRDELIGKTDQALLEDACAARKSLGDEQVLAERRPVVQEDAIRFGQQTVHWFTSKAPLYGEAGELRGLVAISRDVTERKALEEQLLRSQKLELVGQLGAGIAHNFNNVLATILGHAELLLERTDLPAAAREDVEVISRTTMEARKLTRQLLAIGGRNAGPVAPVKLQAVVASVVSSVGRVLGKDVSLQVACDEGLPPILGDFNLLEQLLLNLLVNARDAMPDGGQVTIRTRGEARSEGPEGRRGRFQRLSVQDTGTGMTEEVKAHLFEPFFTTKGPERGSGLGLVSVGAIAKQHGGWVEVESAPGQGTTFHVFFADWHP